MLRKAIKPHIHTLENVHGVISDCVAHLERVGQIADLGEALLDLHSSLLHTLGLSLHQVERVATLSADARLQGRNCVFKEGVADITDTRWIVIVLIVVGKRTPLGTSINDAITDLPGVRDRQEPSKSGKYIQQHHRMCRLHRHC